ncbi:hypothetical protein MYP_3757 [Sporocytophaga myxococcoides]|uniref:DUF7793 domain-containing protein n=1 Tax=Sporocytophaga myxococcoides TaxID=153721 RepID=A0A098LJE7_9BACT|nr:hypothetical protein [Sporocytophaga myxococcoides]GAL86527.1 hypothetical protein MYP_3757 [Sporocytophaga myxococcoides]
MKTVFYGQNIYKEIILRTENAKKNINDRIKFQNGTVYPAISDIRKIKYINKEANEYLSREGNTLVQFESHVNEILGNFYLKLSQPPLPTKLFRNAEKAKT